MKSFLHSLLAATIVVGLFLLGGCSKQLPLTPSSPANSAVSTEDLVATPAGMLPRSHTFLVEPGYHVFVKNGHVWKRQTGTGKLVKDFGGINRSATGST